MVQYGLNEMASAQEDRTTVQVKRRTHTRMKELRPYDSMTFDEFIREMADVYEEHQ